MTITTTPGPVPQLPVIPVPDAPHTLMEAAVRIQKAAAELKAVIPWLEKTSLLPDEQQEWVLFAHFNLTNAAYLLQGVFGQAPETFFGGGSNKNGGGGGGG